MFGYKVLDLETLDPAGRPFFPVLEIKNSGQGGGVCAQMELLPLEMYVEVFEDLENSQ
jgi:hypothetical protein